MKTLRKQIQQLLTQSGRSRNSIAVESRLDPAQLHRLAHGHPGASIDVIEKVAAVLGYRVALIKARKFDKRKAE